MKEKLKDAIYGLAVGDALGVPVEMLERGTYKVDGMIGGGTHHQEAGTWSDDTSMTLATCYSIKMLNKIDVDDIRHCFELWLNEAMFTPKGNVFDCGNTVFDALHRGKGMTSEYSNGNGSLMRILPLAFVDGITNIDIAEVSAITHAHPLSKEGCIIYVKIAKDLLKGISLQEAIQNHVCEDSTYHRLLGIGNLEEKYIKSTGYIVDTLEAAIWSLLTTNSYKEAVLKAVNLGKDTDTVGAVCGGLAGIIYGYDAIPKEWIDVLKNKELINDCLF